jgi:hypothetical protein
LVWLGAAHFEETAAAAGEARAWPIIFSSAVGLQVVMLPFRHNLLAALHSLAGSTCTVLHHHLGC